MVRGTPVKVVWTRKDDMRGGRYRPHVRASRRGRHRQDGMPAAWRTSSSAILPDRQGNRSSRPGQERPRRIDRRRNRDTAIPSRTSTFCPPSTVNVPVLAWRSSATRTFFVMETLIDELAVRAKGDPIAMPQAARPRRPQAARRAPCCKTPRVGATSSARNAVGIASASTTRRPSPARSTFDRGERPRIHRRRRIDCGLAVNPLSVESRFRAGSVSVCPAGGNGAITLKDGQVEQSNFHDFRPLTSPMTGRHRCAHRPSADGSDRGRPSRRSR